MDFTCILLVLAALLVLGYLFMRYMTSTFDTFEKLGIDGPKPSIFMGNRKEAFKTGVFQVQLDYYNIYKDKKVYGWFDGSDPILIVKDLDMIKDIMVKNFSSFTDRRQIVKHEPPLADNMLNLKGERWKRVRGTVSPTFTSGRLRRMFPHIDRNAKNLYQSILTKCESNEEVELKDIFSRFTMDVIASTAFGMETNTIEKPDNPFATKAKQCVQPAVWKIIIALLFPNLRLKLEKLGIPVTMRKSLLFFSNIIDSAMVSRKQDGQVGKVNDFLDLLVDAENESGSDKGKLSQSEIHGQALVFLLAGYETVSTVLSFTMFLLAVHPECLKRVQEEIDQQLGKEEPTYENIQNLPYLDMCVNETIRIFPPGLILDRKCTEAIDVQGVHIPKDMGIFIPVYAIHHDPDIYPEPEKFDPERFSPENKEARHPYAHIPFGYGPRNCVGMRLALVELRVALATILQRFTPVKCDKTVYPVKLSKIMLAANDGLWVKMESRK